MLFWIVEYGDQTGFIHAPNFFAEQIDKPGGTTALTHDHGHLGGHPAFASTAKARQQSDSRSFIGRLCPGNKRLHFSLLTDELRQPRSPGEELERIECLWK